ncbi:hypothetical protein BD410DRAFT_784582 [Rickenella mellea]|uniref:Uncharacterized protein n=1 Tax=Rickenella mellea TaxID=50990 RepID=A0A4Y7QDZ9_9AGAM|nr:hypothetical protein BD410DRAFT_784582 [Rickenella mellea]
MPLGPKFKFLVVLYTWMASTNSTHLDDFFPELFLAITRHAALLKDDPNRSLVNLIKDIALLFMAYA